VTQLVTGEASPGAIALDAGNVYWANDLAGSRAIRKLPKGTSTPGDLAVLEPKKPLAITVSGPYLYWSEERVVPCDAGILDPDNDRILRIDVGGQLPPQPLHASCGKSSSLVVQGGKLYRARPTANRIQRSNLDGMALFTVLDGTMAGATPFGLAVDGVNAYWTDTAHGVLSVCDYTVNCVPQMFADAPGADTRVADDATSVYWTTSSDVRKLDKASPGNMPVVLGSITSTGGIALDKDAVYVTDTLDGKVLRFCKAGGQVTEIATGQLDPRGIAVDASGVYWVNGVDGSVRRAAP
jgi:sugar lactone lactonase YvrE